MTILVPLPTGSAVQDQVNIDAAQAQAASLAQAMQFPDGQVYQVTTGIKAGAGLGPVPLAIRGDHTVLRATTSGPSVVALANVHSLVEHFAFEGIDLDGANLVNRCLSISGGFWMEIHRLKLMRAASIGFAVDAGRGRGFYYNHVSSINIRQCGYLGMQWWDDLQTIGTDGAHIQGNDVHNIQATVCAGGGSWLRGMQGSIRTSQFQECGGWGMIVDNSLTLSLDDVYFEANPINGVDSAVFVDDATVKVGPPFGDGGVMRRGGHWIGRVQGTVNLK